MYADFDTIFDK